MDTTSPTSAAVIDTAVNAPNECLRRSICRWISDFLQSVWMAELSKKVQMNLAVNQTTVHFGPLVWTVVRGTFGTCYFCSDYTGKWEGPDPTS